MEDSEFYKNLSQACDFIVLLMNKVILIINDQMANNSNELIENINKDNLILLKKKYSNYNEIIKNYTTLLTTMNNLIGFDHTINYARKNIVKYSKKAKNLDFIKKKVESLDSNTGLFMNDTQLLLNCLDFFAKRETPNQKNEKSLSDIHKLIEKALETIRKKHFPKVQQLNKALIDNLSKSGGYEIDYTTKKNDELKDLIQSVKNFAIKGGLESSSYKLTLGGGPDPSRVVISGHHVDDFIKKNYQSYQMLLQDIKNFKEKADQDELTNFYQNLLYPAVVKNQAILDLPNEKVFEEIIYQSSALDNLAYQFNILVNDEFKVLLEYHQRRGLGRPPQISIQKSEKTLWDPQQIQKSITDAMNQLVIILTAIDDADYQKCISDIKDCFALSSITEQDKFNSVYQELQEDFKTINDPNYNVVARKNAKTAIKKIIDTILAKTLQIKPPKIIKPRTFFKEWKTGDPIPTLDEMERQLSIIDQASQIQVGLSPELKQFEVSLDDIATQIYDLILELNSLISPANKYTCIKRISLFINIGIRAMLLKLCYEKRFKSESKDVLSELDSIMAFIFSGINTTDIYTVQDGLNFDVLKKIAELFCGSFH